MNNFYNITTKFTFKKLDTPICVWQQREQIYRKYRDGKVDFINFDYDDMEGTVYDFKIGNLKIQEKVSQIHDGKYWFKLCKNNGRIDNKQNQSQYDIGDNDFYWLNCDDKQTFFVIPEKMLIDRGLIGNNKKNKILKITINKILHAKSKWLQSYRFDYENIEKDRLLNILN